ncbi:17403_t:CDS:2 [Funneliformis caledonium]|uniref:17403_t:CDS:1 n=1 Tax=Funneliformis caledonium TaxID=1117310 RepID=A0A9N9AGB5_9GLOM|nr:17403_t:CDS:2 [Funneliformis caledonium]
MSNYEDMETIEEGSTFRNWDEAKTAIYLYANKKGFNLCKSRNKKHEGGELRKRTFICEFSGKPQKKKTNRPSKSKKISCPWHINLSLPAQNNHENLVKITNEGGAATQRKYLHAKYPGHPLSNQDLSNAIMQYKPSKEDHNTIMMLKYLIKQKENSEWKVYYDFEPDNDIAENFEWILKCTLDATKVEPKTIITDMERGMDTAVECVYLKAWHRHSTWHLSLNLENNVKIKLGPKYQEFLYDFFACRNSLQEESFQKKWDYLIGNYLEIADYLTNTLYESKKYWAKALIDETFTADIDSNYELIHDPVKQALINSNVVIVELIDYINDRIEKQFYEKYDRELIEWSSYRTRDDINNAIEHALSPYNINNYLSPACAKLQLCEIELSREIVAKKYDIGVIEKKSMEEIEEIGLNFPLENDCYAKQISLKKLFSWIDTKNINETWSVDCKVSSYYDHTNYILLMNDGSHLCTCLRNIYYGIIFRHYFQVMNHTHKAKFHITMISKRWYQF